MSTDTIPMLLNCHGTPVIVLFQSPWRKRSALRQYRTLRRYGMDRRTARNHVQIAALAYTPVSRVRYPAVDRQEV